MSLRVCFSGNGQGALAATIRERLELYGSWSVEFVDDDAHDIADVAICTTGGMLIREAGKITATEYQRLHEGNYKLPREFTERHIRLMRKHSVRGLIINIGSNASWYGNVHAEDYAAFKTALRRYLELRARDVKQYGIRLSHLAFGGIEGPFWAKATDGVPDELTKGIVSNGRQMLTLQDAASVVLATMMLPPNVVARDCLFVSTDYQ